MRKFSLLVCAVLCLSACSDEVVTPQQNTPSDPTKPSGCHEGYRRCKDNFVQFCESGEWKNTDACPYGCDTQKFVCLSDPGETPEPPTAKCQQGEELCTNGTMMTCPNGEWEKQNCEFGCAPSGKACAECSSDKCEGDQKTSCANGAWVLPAVTCPEGCNDEGTDCSQNTAECDEGQMLCSESQLKKCTNQTWSVVKACPDGCNAEQTDCLTKVCNDGDSICADGNVKNCMDNAWSTPAPCPYGCDDTGKVCAESNNNQPTRYIIKDYHSPVTPYVAAQMKAIAAKDTSQKGNVFMKVGDSHYDANINDLGWNYGFMTCFSNQTKQAVTLDKYADLQAVVDAFQADVDSFNRDSDTAVGAQTTSYVLKESRLENEIKAIHPRFAFFGFGTNDMGSSGKSYGSNSGYPKAMETYFRNVSKVVDKLMAAGVIPLISGVAPNYRKPADKDADQPQYAVPAFDAITRGIAEARQIPWYDTYNNFMALPSHGLRDDNVHESTNGSPCNFTADGLKNGANARNLGSIQMLRTSWDIVVNNGSAPDAVAEPFKGTGTPTDPFLITSLPYTHLADTSKSTNSLIQVYAGECKDSPEYGPEYYYKLTLEKKTQVKIFVVSADNADVDLHVLKEGTGADKCFRRSNIYMQGYLDAGTYYIVIDTYGKTGETEPGQYLMGIVNCESGDPNCSAVLKSY